MLFLYNLGIKNNQIEKYESVQYSAALAVTDAWRETSCKKLYDEVGRETINLRRWSRRLILFFKLNDLPPSPIIQDTPFQIFRNKLKIFVRRTATGQIFARTKSFKVKLPWIFIPQTCGSSLSLNVLFIQLFNILLYLLVRNLVPFSFLVICNRHRGAIYFRTPCGAVL